ncbi:MAG TPA: tryptophan--tRNA ligase [Alphaproteobacteria bacterium]|nr:tryptophan--tRNA ligase [Alphaproteobacteria bacterium]
MNQEQKVILTGIKPTGMPHLGNLCGAIKPMVEFINQKQDNETIYCFIPDIHALNGGLEPAKIREYSYGLIATYLACGMDPSKVIMFRQSAIRQHAELATLLTPITPKGMMNRAHSYKAAVDKNKYKFIKEDQNTANLIEFMEQNKEYAKETNQPYEVQEMISKQIDDMTNLRLDAGINMGLYTYPILMAADILLYHTNTVPVGKDQIQHIEMTRDLANSFNTRYSPTFTMPDYESKDDAPEISGLDGRKMSKSYGNHIPIFCNEMELKGYIKKIITDSAKPEEPKDVENSTLVQLYELFADEAKTADYKERLAKGGFGYGDAKQELFDVINNDLAPKREIYNELMANRKKLEEILRENEEQARRVAEKTMRKVRKKMGLVDVI